MKAHIFVLLYLLFKSTLKTYWLYFSVHTGNSLISGDLGDYNKLVYNSNLMIYIIKKLPYVERSGWS